MSIALVRRRVVPALPGACSLVLVAVLAGCGQGDRKAGQGAKAAKPGPSQAAPAKTEPKTPGTPAKTEPTTAAAPAKATPAGNEKSDEFTSCGGEKTVTVAKGLSGQALADALMAQWQRDHPGRDWVAEEKQRHAFQPPADNSDVLRGDQAKANVYGKFTERDLLDWTRETEKLVAEGSRVFHDADALGGTVAVSCDMCHPHAANTHPETYPKFQVQLGRTALLRDMINWCIENPVRGKQLQPDDPRMRAIEAYIMAQRKGVAMDYGKH